MSQEDELGQQEPMSYTYSTKTHLGAALCAVVGFLLWWAFHWVVIGLLTQLALWIWT